MTTSLLSGLMSSTFAGENSPPTGALKVTATVNVNLQAKERSVAPSFLGLSMVLSETPYMVGTRTSPNPHFRQLLGNLLAYSNGPMEIRELNDKAFGPTTIPDHLPALANLYRDMQSPQHGVKYFMGVDFSGNFDAQGNENGIAASQAESFRSLLPQGSVLSYEIGNEPDLYNAEHSRSNYTYAKYKLQYEQTVAAIESKGTGVPMAAPVFSGYPGGFMKSLDDFIASEHAHLGMLDLHYYGGSHCNGKVVPADYLLSSEAINHPTSTASPDRMGGYIAALNRTGRGNVRIGEMNSVACGGQDGVSNTFQSALWVLDEAMSYAEAGVSGINIFTIANANAYYTPFRFSHTGTFPESQYTISQINPIYYGMLAVDEMLQSKAALLPASLSTSLNIKAYATTDEHGKIRVLLINKEEGQAGDGDVVLHLARHGDAEVSALRATNNDYRVSDYTHYTDDDKVTLAGQTFKVAGSVQDGVLHGTRERTTVHPKDGVYVVPLPHASAAIVEFR